mmetsp:Transcript_119062/g.344368  ORF Transcript_119062/g.344368 Transcript_119062/m.344368 type:complete len:373 (-) Transcript_119062:1025-2143(-)
MLLVEVEECLRRADGGREYVVDGGAAGEAKLEELEIASVGQSQQGQSVSVQSNLHLGCGQVCVDLVNKLPAIRVVALLCDLQGPDVVELVVEFGDPARRQLRPRVRHVLRQGDVCRGGDDGLVFAELGMVVDAHKGEAVVREGTRRADAALRRQRQATDAAMAALTPVVVAIEALHAAAATSLALPRVVASAAPVSRAFRERIHAPRIDAVVASLRATVVAVATLHAAHTSLTAGLAPLEGRRSTCRQAVGCDVRARRLPFAALRLHHVGQTPDWHLWDLVNAVVKVLGASVELAPAVDGPSAPQRVQQPATSSGSARDAGSVQRRRQPADAGHHRRHRWQHRRAYRRQHRRRQGAARRHHHGAVADLVLQV